MEEQEEFREYDFESDSDVGSLSQHQPVDIDQLKQDILNEIQDTYSDQQDPMLSEELVSQIV